MKEFSLVSQMSRREALLFAARGTAAVSTLALASTLLPNKAQAVPWLAVAQAVVSIVQIGSQLASQAESANASPQQLLSLQLGMTRELSKQISAVSFKLDLLLKEMSELKERTIALPDETTRTLLSTLLAGKLSSLTEVTVSFERTAENYGRANALHDHANEFRALLREIRDLRNSLFQSKSELTILAICSAFRAELGLHLLLLSPAIQVRTVCDAYLAYLNDRLIGPDPDSIREQLNAINQKVGAEYSAYVPREFLWEPRPHPDYTCKKNFSRRRSIEHRGYGREGDSDRGYDGYWRVQGTKVIVAPVAPNSDSERANRDRMNAEIKAVLTVQSKDEVVLIKSVSPNGSILDTPAWPTFEIVEQNLYYRTSPRNGGRGVWFSRRPSDPPEYTSIMSTLSSLNECQSRAENSPEAILQKFNHQADELQSLMSKAQALTAIRNAARKTIASIEKIVSELGVKPG